MKVIDAIAEIMKREGVQFLSCYPTTPIIESCAAVGIRPYLCRQERVGAGIADGYSRVTNGKPSGVFAMQYAQALRMPFQGSRRRIPIRRRSWYCRSGISGIGPRSFPSLVRRGPMPR
jgi:hypothetical protein